MASSKQKGGAKGNNNRSSINTNNAQIYTLHQRLHHALNLGTRFRDQKEWKWQCTDIEIQRHVARSIAAFLDCISRDTSRHSLDSVADICKALVWILQDKNVPLVSIAADVVVKLISRIPSSILQPYMLDLVHPLSSLLSSHQLDVSTTCATSLNMILSNLSTKKEKEVWEILKETDTVACVVRNIRNFSGGSLPVECFLEIAFLLSTILRHWPASRYSVWTDAVVMRFLETVCSKPDLSGKVAVMKIYSALALCGEAAKMLLENGEALLQHMVHCMDSSQPVSARIEGFRLARHFMRDQHGFSKMINCCCEPLVEAIICGMTGWDLRFGKVPSDRMSLLEEACHLALLTHWEGEHHIYFWKHGIGSVLFSLVVGDLHSELTQHSSSWEVQISVAQKVQNANFLLALRPYIWDILGWLATHCGEDFDPTIHGQEMHVSILITCACLGFVDAIRRGNQICQSDVTDTLKGESASRAVLLTIYSPCKYISSKAKLILSQILEPNGEEYLQRLLHTVNLASSGQVITSANICQTMINVMGLTCYSGLPQYKMHIIEGEGVKILLSFLKWCLSIDVRFGRLSFAAHLHDVLAERTCCWVSTEEWDGEDALLLYGLWGLSELLQHSGAIRNNLDTFSGKVNCTKAQLVSILQEIYSYTCAPGPKWYAAYILSHFGFYGFPNQLANKIGKALSEKNYADLQFIHPSGMSSSAHGVVLAVRCPSLLPSEQLMLYEKTSDGSSDDTSLACGRFQKEIRLSAQVDYQALVKLLEFVYLGHLEGGEELEKKLKALAKRCNLQSLSQMLCRKRPKWGTPIPSFDLTLALSSTCHRFCDAILEANGTEQTHWTCSICIRPVPHAHVHKVVLWSSCDYMRALFDSGMEESRSQTVKVPVTWEAMIKLVEWFYTNRLPSPPSGCLWDNMNTDEMLAHLKPYVELSWLAEYWFLHEVHDACYRVIVSCLDSARSLSIDMIQIAANFSQWNLSEVAANYMAPLYCQLRDSGALEMLDEQLVDIVRAASVRLSQEGDT